jgi:hypothetical protein
MTSTKKALLGVGGLAISLVATSLMAQPDFSRLGQDLTPIGAERAGNAAGTIPEWTGGLRADAGRLLGDGFAENPFAGERPQFVITAQNYRDYADNLTPGQIAMFERYPETFRMPIYETRRSVGYKQEIYDKVREMAGMAQLVNNGDGITNFPHATMPTDALLSFRDTMLETRDYGFDKVREEQIELGRAVRALLAEKGFVSVAAKGFEAPGVVVSYTSDDSIQNGKAFIAQGLQTAAGVPLMCDEPASFKTFRIGLFGLDKLHNVERSVANLRRALESL